MKVPSPLLKNLRKAMDQVVLDMVSVRRYLKSAAPMNGHELVVDAVVAGDLGARDILKLALASRVNRRTRRSLWTVDRMARVRAPARAGWYIDLCEGVYGLYRQLLVLGLPNTAPTHQLLPAGDMSRRLKQSLRSSGVVKVATPCLADRGDAAAELVWETIRNCDTVLWVDNWYVKRYGTDPIRGNLSLNVTAMAVLPLSRVHETRATTFPRYLGHLPVGMVIGLLGGRVQHVLDCVGVLQTRMAEILANATGGIVWQGDGTTAGARGHARGCGCDAGGRQAQCHHVQPEGPRRLVPAVVELGAVPPQAAAEVRPSVPGCVLRSHPL